MSNLMENLGTKIGAEFKAHRLRIETVESTKVDKISGKGLSTEDYTTAEKSKLAGVEAGAQVNTVISVAGKTGAVSLAKSDVGLGSVDNTADVNKSVLSATKWTTSRLITLGGDASGSVSIDGNSDVTLTVNVVDDSHSHAFGSLTGKPTTVAGYGITDVYTKTQTDSNISTAVAELVNGSPAALDTLNELAAALGNNASFATTVTTQLGLKANTSSLSTVATSGSYNDLSNKPTFPSSFADANGWITIGANWKVRESGGVLLFAHGSTNRMKLDSSGNLTVTGDVTAFGSV